MTLDKDDLFRNAVPGFVFILVILSFDYVTRGSFPQVDLLSIIVVFPIGFIIQSIHRFVFHILRCEQKTMRDDEYQLLEKYPELLKQILDRLKKIGGNDREEFAQWVAFSLDEEQNKCFKIRIDFLNSYFQALGASALAVGMAVFVSLVIYFPKSIFYAEPVGICLQGRCIWKIILFLLWIVILRIFWYGREEIRKEYKVCRRLFIKVGNLTPVRHKKVNVDIKKRGLL